MKKLLVLGVSLSKLEQKKIIGGYDGGCTCDEDPCRNKTSNDICQTSFGQGKCTYQACTGCGYYFYNCVLG